MRYRFRGLIRTTGQSVDGHVQAPAEEVAFNVLAEHGIVTESLVPDPIPEPPPMPELPNMGMGQMPGLPANGGPPRSGFDSVIDSALDTSSAQVPFDALTQRFRGKNVWVIDRDKIRQRVRDVVDAAIAEGVTDDATKQAVAQAIDGLFKDNRNLTSKAPANSGALDEQIDRLGAFIHKAEGLLAQMAVAINRIGSGGGGGGGGGWGPRRSQFQPRVQNEQNEVLLEIFKSNLELQRGIDLDKKEENGDGSAIPAAESTAAPGPAPEAQGQMHAEGSAPSPEPDPQQPPA